MSDSLDRAWEHFARGEYADAMREAGEAIRGEGESAAALALIALCHLATNRPRAAMRAARSALRLDPNSAHALEALARAYLARGKTAKALEVFKEATSRHPENVRLLRLHASALIDAGRATEAGPVVERALRIDPGAADLYVLHANALFEQGRFDRAEDAARAALRENPLDADAHAVLGWTLLGRRRAIEAIGVLRESLRLYPHSDWARWGVLEALSARNRFYAFLLAPTLWAERRKGWPRRFALWAYAGIPMALAALAVHIPPFAILAVPAVAFLVVTVVARTVMRPLMRVLLRFDREGNRFLKRDEKIRMDAWFMFGLGVVGGVTILGDVPAVFGAWCTAWAFVPYAVHARKWSVGPSRGKARWLALALGLCVLAAEIATVLAPAWLRVLLPASWLLFFAWCWLAPEWARRENLA